MWARGATPGLRGVVNVTTSHGCRNWQERNPRLPLTLADHDWTGCSTVGPMTTPKDVAHTAAGQSMDRDGDHSSPHHRWLPGRWSRWALAAGLAWSLLMALAFPLPGLAPRPGNESTSGWAAMHIWCQGGIWPLALLAWAPLALFVASTARDTTLRCGRVSLWFGIGTLPFWGFEQWWVSRISAVGWLPMIAYLALFGWLHCWGALRIARHSSTRWYSVIVIATWVLAVEFFRGEFAFKGYPWYLPGHPLIRWGPGASLASLFGAYGVSIAVLFFSLGLGWIIRGIISRQPKQPGALAVAVGACFFLPVAFLTRHPTAAPPQIVTIALIQTNVPQDLKVSWSPEQQFKEWQTIESMTARAAQPGVGLIVWPETMMPGITIDDAGVKAMKDAQIYYNIKTPEGEQKLAAHAFADRLRAVQQELKVPLLIGEEGIENLRFAEVEGGIDTQYDKRFNSAFMVQDGKVDPLRYDKLHLTPFGEEMPYISSIKWLERLFLSIGARGMTFDLSQGRKPIRLVPRVKLSGPGSAQSSPDAMGTSVMPIATPICFEIANSSLVRSVVQATTPSMPLPTMMIITITNDGWFGDSDMTRRQHVQLARWRAAELGLPVLRAANTGDSCGFDAWARPIAPLGLPPAPRSREEGICMLQVPLYSVTTLYYTIGNAVGWGFAALGAVAFALTFRKSK